MYGTDYNYASSRLAGTVVRLLTGEPVIIDDVHPRMVVTAVKLDKLDELIRVQLSDLNLKPVSLGMCNFKGITTYLCRKPMRRDWKQGLRAGNFTSLTGFPAEAIPPGDLSKVIRGDYPTIAQVIELFKKDKNIEQLAWCREWAVSRNGSLHYKGSPNIGELIGIDNCALRGGYEHLRESFLESV